VTLTPRQRFLNQMHYQPVDRSCLYDFSCWDECIPLWQAQGLPAHYTRAMLHEYFGLDATLGAGSPSQMMFGGSCDLLPGFEEQVLDDQGETERVRQADGAIVIRGKGKTMSIPTHVGHTLADRASWETHYKPRLDPATPGRFPDHDPAHLQKACDPQRDVPCGTWAGSVFGRLRDWMGLENIALVPYEDPAWFEEMVTTMGDLAVAMLKRTFEAGAVIDYCAMWEDMACNSGPLLSPDNFKRYLVPQYKRITEVCHAHGVDTIHIDCDGWIDALIPHWLDAGINCMFPVEVGTWNGDPARLRREYGTQLLMMGGFDKRILATSPEAITAEVRRLAPLVESGGFIGFCDHRVPPDVSLANYCHYAREARAIWGKGMSLPAAMMDENPASA